MSANVKEIARCWETNVDIKENKDKNSEMGNVGGIIRKKFRGADKKRCINLWIYQERKEKSWYKLSSSKTKHGRYIGGWKT